MPQGGEGEGRLFKILHLDIQRCIHQLDLLAAAGLH